MKTNRCILLLVAAALLGLAGCERRPLEDTNNAIMLKLKINMNIQNVDPSTIGEPEVMRVIFYNPNTKTKITEDYLPGTSGHVNIPAGNYSLLVYNFDTESTLVRNDSYFHDVEAYTNTIPNSLRSNVLKGIQKAQETRSDNETKSPEEIEWENAMKALQESEIVYEPDHLFVARQPVTIYANEGEQIIEADAESVVETYYLSVRVTNIRYMASATALLTGQVKSNHIGYDKEAGKSTEDVTLYFNMAPGTDAEDNDVVCAHFNTFGKLPNSESRLWLTILITNTDGSTDEWHKDITDEFHEDDPDDDKQIIIVDKPITIEEPDDPTPSGGGFTPTVEDWEEEHYDISI